MKLAADYTRLNFRELLELDCVSYLTVVRDAFVYKLKQTEEGREILENDWLLKQTAPDRKKLRETFK